MSDSTNLSLILEILTSQKVYDETTKTWRVYDANGSELVDSGGILMQGLHGFLLNNHFVQVGAASYDAKKRRKNIVNIDGVLYEFASEAEAISFINLQDEAVNDDPVAENVIQPEPIKTVDIKTVESFAESDIISATPMDIYNYVQFADYAAIIAAYNEWLHLDEEEALLLLM